MALYEVKRTDNPEMGEFAEGIVIAYSKKQARYLIARHHDVDPGALEVTPVPTTGVNHIISVYFAEA